MPHYFFRAPFSLQTPVERSERVAAVMLAYLRSPTHRTLALFALVGADARSEALLARAPAAVMLAYLRFPAFLKYTRSFRACRGRCSIPGTLAQRLLSVGTDGGGYTNRVPIKI